MKALRNALTCCPFADWSLKPFLFALVLVEHSGLPTASAQSLTITAVELGAFGKPATVRARDGVGSVLLGGKMLWTFGYTFFNTVSEDSMTFRTNTAALSDPDDPLNLVEPLDANGSPFQAIPFTAAEKAYNDSTGVPSNRIAIWPAGLLRDSDTTAFAFFNVLRITPSEWARLGTGTAHFKAGSTQAVRHEGFLFGPEEPSFSIVFVENDTLYLYGRLPAPNPFIRMGIARVPIDSVRQRQAYRFWNGTSWVTDIDSTASIMGWINGLGIAYNAYLESYLAVHSQPFSDR